MSMMVAAATIFPSPVKGFGFKKHTTTNANEIFRTLPENLNNEILFPCLGMNVEALMDT